MFLMCRSVSFIVIYTFNVCPPFDIFEGWCLRFEFDIRTGIGRVQHRLSQKCVGLWQYFQELFFFTKLRIWLMVCFSDPVVLVSRGFGSLPFFIPSCSLWCEALKSSNTIYWCCLILQVVHLYLLDFLSIQKRMAWMMVKAFLLDGKNPWEHRDILFASHLAYLTSLRRWGGTFAKVIVYFAEYFSPHIFFMIQLEWKDEILLSLFFMASRWLCFLILPCIPFYTPYKRPM